MRGIPSALADGIIQVSGVSRLRRTRGQRAVSSSWSFGWSLVFDFTLLIKVIHFLVNKFLDQCRLFFGNSFFFPRSLAQAMICSTFPILFDIFRTSLVRRSLRLIFF